MMKRRILSFCLLCCLLLTGIKMPVLATSSGRTVYQVSTLADLRTACAKDNAEVILGADITGAGNSFLLDISGDNVLLDLGGHTLCNIVVTSSTQYGGTIQVSGSNVTIQNGTLEGHSIYSFGVLQYSTAKNLTVSNITASGNMGCFLFSRSTGGGVVLVEDCSVATADTSVYPAILSDGNHVLVLDDVYIMHGGNNSSYGDDPASYYPAIQIESGIEITLVNLFVDKRAAGLILESYNTSYSTYGYLTAPDAQIDVDGSSVSHTKSLDQGTNGGSACKRIQGLSLFISSDMKAITDVDCTIHVPVTGQEPDYSPVCTGSLYYLNAHNIGNILNDTSWQVWTGSSWDMNAVNPGDHFEGARSYRVLFDVTALDGYFFANGLVGTLNGAVPSDYWVGGFQTTYRFIQEFPKTKAGWCKIDNKWYYYDSDGSKHTGWLKLNGKYYYMDSNGVMQTGWKKVNGKYYYMNSSGVMLTGWQKIGGKWYYLETSGAMVIGWKKLENQWYYFSSSGAMVTGWQDINGKTYYFKSSGVMAAKEWCNGWWLNADGTWTYKYKASWKQNSNGWWFGDTSGWYAKNTTIMIDGKLYTFNAAGYWVQ